MFFTIHSANGVIHSDLSTKHSRPAHLIMLFGLRDRVKSCGFNLAIGISTNSDTITATA